MHSVAKGIYQPFLESSPQPFFGSFDANATLLQFSSHIRMVQGAKHAILNTFQVAGLLRGKEVKHILKSVIYMPDKILANLVHINCKPFTEIGLDFHINRAAAS